MESGDGDRALHERHGESAQPQGRGSLSRHPDLSGERCLRHVQADPDCRRPAASDHVFPVPAEPQKGGPGEE